MTHILSSQGVVLATAMVVSSTVIYFAFSKQITLPQLPKTHNSQPSTRNLRPCLCSERKVKAKEKKKKRVQFADDVKDTKGNGNEYRKEKETNILAKQAEKEKTSRIIERPCRDQIMGEVKGMPANRIALYNGILRDRVHRVECSF